MTAVTDDGCGLLMLDERGFVIGVGLSTEYPWAYLCLDDIEGDTRELFWMDEDDGAEDH